MDGRLANSKPARAPNAQHGRPAGIRATAEPIDSNRQPQHTAERALLKEANWDAEVLQNNACKRQKSLAQFWTKPQEPHIGRQTQ